MAVNTMTFEQVSTVLNSIHQQVTGQVTIAATDTASFVQQATSTLTYSLDTIYNAINQVLSRTIFSIRPYSSKFRGLEVSEAAWGNHVRKLSIADTAALDDDRYKWPVAYDSTNANPTGNGQSVDPYKIYKPDLLQTNFYGYAVYENAYTLHRDQLEQAFRGPEEMAGLISLILTNRSNKLEQYRENFARYTLANYMGGLIMSEGAGIRGSGMGYIPLLTLYNSATGLSLTSTTVYQPANFKAFCQWCYAYIAKIARFFTERSEQYQTTINNKHIIRHTDYSDQRVYLSAGDMFAFEMMALADTYHDSYLTMVDHEAVSYWQSIGLPGHLDLTCSWLKADGTVDSGDINTTIGLGPILGVIFDRDACGFAQVQEWSAPAYNARGGYTTYWDHATLRCWNDLTEKGVVLMMA